MTLKSISSVIIYNLSQFGISISDSKYIDIQAYLEIIEIHSNNLRTNTSNKVLKQNEIDRFFL